MAMFLPKIGNSYSDVPQIMNDADDDNHTLKKNNNNQLFQKGRSYNLGDSKVPHMLPHPGQLKPYADRVAGEMEIWPAHSNFLSTSQVKTASKPTFLQKLEGYLNRELRILGCSGATGTTPSEKRLQVFREVFEYLIDDFRTYKPLLSSIKQEYESMLTSQKETIRSLEPLKAMLVNVNDQCEQKVLNLKQDDKKDLALAKKKNAELDDIIMTLKEEIVTLKFQIKKCQSEVEDVYKKYRDESDSKKLLVQSMNDLKYQFDDSKNAALRGNSNDDAEEEGDSTLLRIALKKAREDLDKKTVKLAEVLADYGDVVPRRDFEKMEITLAGIEEEVDLLKKNHEVLMKEHAALIEVHKQVLEQRDSFASDCERMRESATPRPDWKKCALYIEGGNERWSELSAEKSTNDKVDILLAEMTGQDISVIKAGGGVVEFFEPNGIGEDIPPYLRSTEKVRNRRLGKRDLLILIKEVWQKKIKEEGSTPFTEHSPMQDYLYKYLKQCFSVDNMVVEWGYNINDAMVRYNFEPNVAVWSGILKGELDEDIYYNNLSQLEGLYHVFSTSDNDDSGGLDEEVFQNCISNYFPYFSSETLSNILRSAEDELKPVNKRILYRDLFTEDDEGSPGTFVAEIQKLLKDEKEKFLKEIELYLENRNVLSRDDFTEALQTLNPNINQEMCEPYVNLGFRSEEKIDLQTLINNLSRSCIMRI